MNGSTSPHPQPHLVESVNDDGNSTLAPDAAGSLEVAYGNTEGGDAPASQVFAAPAPEQPEAGSTALPEPSQTLQNGADDEAMSEAETLIDSPVKKREEQPQSQPTQQPKPARSRIGGLPVPGEDDEESESVATPMQSTEMSDAKAPSSGVAKETLDEMDLGSDGTESNDSLSSAPSPTSTSISMASPHSRALSEGPEAPRNGAVSPNERKRKHRASSVGFPDKRRSMDPPRRVLRTMHSEDIPRETRRSPSPRPQSHRRAVSTQSAINRLKERPDEKPKATAQQFPVLDARSTRTGWEESDASSETTSLGHVENRRPQRGVGRSTSTPGRPAAREHKRHVNRYGFTRLAEAVEANDLNLVKEWREKDPDQLELPNYALNKPLQIAAVHGHAEIVAYLIDQGCQIECANVDKDTPLIDAAENGYLEVVKTLLAAGVDPLRQNLKGQQALDVVTDDNEEADGIRAALRHAIESWASSNAKQQREEEEEARHKIGPSKELHFMARSYENLLRLVTINDRNGVREFLDARVPVDNQVIAIAAKTGDQYLVNMLLAEMHEKKAHQKPEKPMLAVLGTSHFEMVKMLTGLDQFKPLWRNRNDQTWADIADERNGPNWRQERELLQRLIDAATGVKARRSSSPVTKRESVKRRLPQHHENGEQSDEGDGPKPKNNRRLMSRRAIRVASGKARSDHPDSDGDYTSDTGTGPTAETAEAEPVMGPPDNVKGSTGARQRTKSMSAHSPDVSPRMHRRRTSSLQGPPEQPLPTVVEMVEDLRPTEHELQLERAKFVLLQAQALETKRREAEIAEAENIRIEAQKAEEERQAAAAREEAEVARKTMEAERARQAEEARQADEERKRKEAEMEGARGEFRRGVLALLPPAIARALDPDSDFQYDGDTAKGFLLEHCTPLLTLGQTPFEKDAYVLNVQAAPLLGKRGLELLLPQGHELGFDRSFCDEYPTVPLAADHELLDEHRRVLHQVAVLASTSFASDPDGVHEMDVDDATAFQTELKRGKEHVDAIEAAKRTLSSGALSVEWVSLGAVWDNLDPLFANTPIEVRRLRSTPGALVHPIIHFPGGEAERARDALARRDESFVGRLRRFWEEVSAATRTFVDGEEQVASVMPVVGTTRVMMVHEK
ncbi:hypothetical protein LTR87_006512 [Friedmanniomyces endolithicus]|nr:hypothetical protein LTR87_006512 [Friedmanniomyces endolithicus]